MVETTIVSVAWKDLEKKKKQIGLQCIHVSGVNHVSLKNVVIMKRVSLECSVALKSFEYTFKTFPVWVIQ